MRPTRPRSEDGDVTAGVSDVLRWNLDGIETVASALKEDATTLEQQGSELRNDAERTFEWMSGATIDAARQSTDTAVKRGLTLNDQLIEASDILSNFAKNADVPQQRLRNEVTQVRESGAAVAEDGTITPPPGADSSTIEDLQASADIISSNLESLRTLDSDAAAALNDLTSTVADYSDNADPTTTIAGMVHTTITGAISEGFKEFGDGSTVAKGASKLLGPFGNLLGFATGVAGAPDDESIGETLAAEGGGAIVGIAGSIAGAAATGAVVGSVVPGLGTAAGAVGGLILGAGSSFLASKLIRDRFDDEREG